jgi:1-acyl-sn-glycerol-3-phosphate acyltransferase
MKATIGSITRVFWLGKVEGKHNVPKKGPVIIAPNHQSMLDFCFLAVALNRRLYFLVAKRFYKNVIARFALERMRHVRVDLDEDGKKRLYADAKHILANDGALVVFPEGWMTFDGKIQRGYLGVARMALASKVDIVPTVIESYHIYPRHQKWPKFFNARCRIKFLDPIKYKTFKARTPEYIVHELLMPAIAKDLGHKYPNSGTLVPAKKEV